MPGLCGGMFSREFLNAEYEKEKRRRQRKRRRNNEEEEEQSEDGLIGGDIGLDDLEGLAELSEQDMDSSEEEDEESEEEEEGEEMNDEMEDEEEEESAEEEKQEEDEEQKKSEKPSRRMRLKERLAQRKATETRTVFVGNAPTTATRKEMRKLFRSFGRIEAVYQRTLLQMTEKLTKLMQGKDKTLQERLTSTNFFVRFTTVDEAEDAAKKMNGTQFGGHTLRVTLSTQHKFDNKHSIFLGNLPFNATDDQVRAHFTVCGPVTGVRILHNKQTGLGTGAGYVEFGNRESMLKALELDGQELDGRQLRVSKVFKKKKRPANVGGASSSSSNRSKKRGGQQKKQHGAEVPKGLESIVLLKRKRTKAGEGGDKKAKLTKKVRKEIKKRRRAQTTKSLIT